MEENLFKDVVRISREKKKLSQQQLAEMIGVSVKDVKAWEKGTKVPNDDTINDVLSVLELTKDEFVMPDKALRRITPFKIKILIAIALCITSLVIVVEKFYLIIFSFVFLALLLIDIILIILDSIKLFKYGIKQNDTQTIHTIKKWITRGSFFTYFALSILPFSLYGNDLILSLNIFLIHLIFASVPFIIIKSLKIKLFTLKNIIFFLSQGIFYIVTISALFKPSNINVLIILIFSLLNQIINYVYMFPMEKKRRIKI